MENQQIQLSDESRKQLEQITLAAFHNLLIDVTNQVTIQLASNIKSVMHIQFAASERIRNELLKEQ
jgi:hypothetical protein